MMFRNHGTKGRVTKTTTATQGVLSGMRTKKQHKKT